MSSNPRGGGRLEPTRLRARREITAKLRRRKHGLPSVLAYLALVAGCALVPDESVAPVRGAGSAAALDVHEASIGVARAIGGRVPATCRAPLPRRGPLSVEARIEVVRKAPGVPPERSVEEHLWRRDREGDVSARRVLQTRRPDGRPAVRTREVVRVGDLAYVAIDERFADATRIDGVHRRADALAFSAVDSVLAQVRLDAGRLVAATGDAGLCPGVPVADLPPPSGARLEVHRRGRAGYVTWQDPARGMSVTIRFDEIRRAVAPDVQAPTELWTVDADPSWAEVEGFVEAAVAAGWMQRSPPDGSGASGAQDP